MLKLKMTPLPKRVVDLFLQLGGAADTWQRGLTGEHQLWGVCQDGPRSIGLSWGDGGRIKRDGRIKAFARAVTLPLS